MSRFSGFSGQLETQQDKVHETKRIVLRDGYEYIHFVTKVTDRGKTFWSCRDNKTDMEVGVIGQFKPWKRYAIEFTPKSIFSSYCLTDIQKFMGILQEGYQ